MKQITAKIKELYGKEETFCEAHNFDYKNFSRTKKKHQRWIDEINETYKPLGIEIQIAPLAQTGQKQTSNTHEPPINEPD